MYWYTDDLHGFDCVADTDATCADPVSQWENSCKLWHSEKRTASCGQDITSKLKRGYSPSCDLEEDKLKKLLFF